MKLTVLLVLCVFFRPSLSAQYLFEGVAPAAYHGKVAHLDIIDGWNDFRLIADRQLLAETRIDSLGRYCFTGRGLPAGRGFYRIRFRDPSVSPPTSMWVGNRHYIHFVAAPGDSLRFRNRSPEAPDATNERIDAAATALDGLDDELRRAESDRLTALIGERRKRLIRDALHEADAASNIFLLGHWPGPDRPPLSLLLAEEKRLLATPDLRPVYLTTLRQHIGAEVLDDHRRQIAILRVLLTVAVGGLAALGWLLFRTRTGGTDKIVLSPKEEEVLARIVAGDSNKAIAARLFVSEATIKSHVNSIYKKAGLTKRQEAIAFGRRRGRE